MGMYDYGQRGTYITGFYTFLDRNYPNLKIEKGNQLNEHLKAIRLSQEPNKPVSKDVEKNSFYIQEKYDWSVVIDYFKKLNQQQNN